MAETKGHCPHGEFDLMEGCPQCMAERQEQERVGIKIKVTAPDNAPVGAEEEFAGEIIKLAETIAEIQGVSETVLALRPGEDIEAHNNYDEAVRLLEYAESRVITTLEDSKVATSDLSIISTLKKAMEAKRKEKLAPHEAEVKAIRDTYTFLMTPVLEAERITKEKQVAFLREQERIRREQEEINRKRLEAAEAEMRLKGELTESVNLVGVSEAPKRVTTALGSTGLVDHWKYEVVDFALIPDEYKTVDSSLLNAVARKHHDQKLILGVRFFNEPYIATRSR